MNKEISRKVNIYCIIGMILVMFFLLKIILGNKITSIEEYQEVMKSFGIAGPIVLTVFQALQVVIPILPGYLGCAAGAISFGTFIGFLCNYIGISAGSIIAYFLARKYGVDFIISLFSEKHYLKWKEKVEGKRYARS